MSSSEFDSPESHGVETGDPVPQSQRAGFRVRGRTLLVTIGAIVIAVAVAIVGFGSLGGADSTANAGRLTSAAAAAPSFPDLTADQKTCMKNALGDLVPAAGSALAVPTQDQINTWTSKLKDAMTTCGISMPVGSGFAGGSGFPGLTADQKTCMKNALGDLVPAAGSALAVPTQDQINTWTSKLKDAMTTCGISMPVGSGFAGGSGFPGLTADQKTCMKNALGDLVPAAGSALAVPTQDQINTWTSKLKDAMTTCGITMPATGSGKI